MEGAHEDDDDDEEEEEEEVEEPVDASSIDRFLLAALFEGVACAASMTFRSTNRHLTVASRSTTSACCLALTAVSVVTLPSRPSTVAVNSYIIHSRLIKTDNINRTHIVIP
jgi:hypothetical protein